MQSGANMKQDVANRVPTLSSQVADLEARLQEEHELRKKAENEAEISRNEIAKLKASNAKLKDAIRKVDAEIKTMKPVFYAATGVKP